MTIEVKYHRIHRIVSTFTSPGTDKDQGAYMSYLTGIYHVIYIIEKICEKNYIRSEGITAACGGLNSIRSYGHQQYIFMPVKSL